MGSTAPADWAALRVDSSGNVYGTTWVGGLYAFGTVFEIENGGREKVLHAFWGGADGANPVAGLALDSASNL